MNFIILSADKMLFYFIEINVVLVADVVVGYYDEQILTPRQICTDAFMNKFLLSAF